ncbi:AI-2E family transporter [Halovenus sp. WSH3]|uniref:AI-2E family transporter n=2 Tax=Halovenus carboxidivorans TaxID=2692199 RepID=A0A6B0T6V5_9EURY|nr:AI-2E family transporter [Halovenus carboxidivorans]
MRDNERALFVLLAVIAALALVIVRPVLQYVLLSIVLAYVLYPAHRRLEPVIGSFASAITLIAAALVAIIVPIAYVAYAFTDDLRQAASGDSFIELPRLERRIQELTGQNVDLVSSISGLSERLVDVFFGGITGVLSTTLEFTFGIAMVLFLVFYLLRDGEEFVAWLRELSPLPDADTERLFEKVNKTMWGAVMGHSFAALVQSIVAGVGLWLAGISNPLFWTVVMAILAFLPLIGAFLVWAPAAVYLFVLGETIPAVFLFVYGLTVVSLIDYYARPLVIDKSARLNPGIILVSVFGGIYTLGFVGLFVGPIVIGVLVATLETLKEKKTETVEGSTPQTSVDDEPEMPEAGRSEPPSEPASESPND